MSWLHGRSMGNIPTGLCEKSQCSSAKRQPADTRDKEATRTTGLLKQLQKHHLLLVKMLNLEMVLQYLFDNQVITQEEIVSVNKIRIPYEANSYILRLLHKKPEWCQKLFVQSLERSDQNVLVKICNTI